MQGRVFVLGVCLQKKNQLLAEVRIDLAEPQREPKQCVGNSAPKPGLAS